MWRTRARRLWRRAIRGREGYDTTPALIADLKRRGYWIAIWFVYNPKAGEHYRKAGADAFVTNCKANTFPPPPENISAK